jgi:glutathione synthase/RimK-type ligase-like ATP-grasp enzyme
MVMNKLSNKHQFMLTFRGLVPPGVRKILRRFFSFRAFDQARFRHFDENLLHERGVFPNSRLTVGIVADVTMKHRHYIAACREMGISFKVLDILADDWIERFKASKSDVFLIWPSASGTMIKTAFDMRLKILEEDLGQRVFPAWKECWLTEHKPRLRDWLQAHNMPHPKTNVFFDRRSAVQFCNNADLPVVFKTAIGAAGSGVFFVKSKSKAKKIIAKFFSSGIYIRSFEPWDRQNGYLFVQEYLPDAEEWRMVRIGDSFFGYRKEKGDDGKHSASHKWSWLDPGKELLNLLKKITDTGDFKSMNVDIFKLKDGRLLVNECQTVFGCTTPAIQMKIDDVEGRYLFKEGKWVFEPGEFCRNHMCNLRLEWLLQELEKND